MADSSEELGKSAEKFTTNMENLSFSFKYALQSIREIAKQTGMASEAFNEFRNISNDVTKSLNENKDVMDKVIKGEMTASDVAKVREEHQKKLKKYNEKRASIEKQLSSLSGKGSEKKKKALKWELDNINKKGKDSIKALKLAEDTAKKGNNNISKSLEGIGNWFGKKGFTNFSKSMKGASASLRASKIATGSIGKGMLKLTGIVGKIGKMNPFLAMFGVITSLFKKMLQVNAETAILGRNLGVSGMMASKVRQHYVNIAADVSKFGITYEEISLAAATLNKHLGTSARFIGKEIIGDMAVLMKRTKLTAQAAMGFAQAAMAGSKSVKSLAEDATEGAMQTESEFGVRVDIKTVLEKTGRITGRIRALFGNNLDLMGKTVAKAQLLGLTMQEVASNSAQMLDFHSSIEKEITAELFLNKKLNLERARLASLTGDLDTYMDEIRNNAGDFWEFSQMNVLQQNALAQALGMNVDQLSNMLMREENLYELKERARREGKKELMQNLEQLSVQEAWNEGMRMLKNIVLNMMAKLEAWEIPGWVSKLLTGDRQALKGKKIGDLVNEESTEKAIMSLQNINKDDSIYGEQNLGSRFAPGSIELSDRGANTAPMNPNDTPINVNVSTKLTTNSFEGNVTKNYTAFDDKNSGRNYGERYG